MIVAKQKGAVKDTMKQEGLEAMPEDEFWREPLDDAKEIKKEGNIHILEFRCKGCGFCIEFCPKKVFIQSEGINERGYHPPEAKNPDDCVFCELCMMVCPDFAIYVEVTKSNEDEINNEGSKNSKKDEK